MFNDTVQELGRGSVTCFGGIRVMNESGQKIGCPDATPTRRNVILLHFIP